MAIYLRSYFQHILSALWRRKSGALALVMTIAVLLLFIQYNSVIQHDDVIRGSDHGQGNLKSLRTLAYNNKKNNTSIVAADTATSTLVEIVDILERQRAPPPGFHINRFRPKMKTQIGSIIRLNENIDKAMDEAAVQQSDDPAKIPLINKSKHGIVSAVDISLVDSINNDNIDIDNNKRNVDENNNGNSMNLNTLEHRIHFSGPSGESHSQNLQQPEYSSLMTPYVPLRRLLHLDLKGAPPKVSYLKRLFPLFRHLGATGLLIEYEDMFPYEGDLAHIVAKNHYTKSDVRDILRMAKENELEVIPLLQTFGHAEFLLKHESFSHIREVANQPQSFCPSRNESMSIIEHMIDQVMAEHPDIHWLHIGCDEVFQLGVCSKCMLRSMTQGRDAIFLSHVTRVASYVRERYNVAPIIWDDMLHHMSTQLLKSYNLGNLVEIMVWTYVQDIYRFIPRDVWAMYGDVFPYVWSASAFKGAFGETLTVPPLKMHLENNIAWLDVMAREKGRFQGEFRGIALTGWQRYDHFATLCELLPAGLPSLALNMLTVSHGFCNESWMHVLYDGLQCMKAPKYNTFVNLEVDPFLWDKMAWCFFPGMSFFKMTQRLDAIQKSVSQFLNDETIKKAWLTEYNVRHNFSSILRIDASMSNFPFHFPDVETLIRNARDTLREVFDEYTVAEWIEQNVYPLLRRLELFKLTAESLKVITAWPARPFEPLPDLQKYGIGIPTDNPPVHD